LNKERYLKFLAKLKVSLRFYQERAFVAEVVSNGSLRENICVEKEKEQNHCSHVDHYLANKTLSTVEISIEAGGDASQWQG
jgi:hypothetical protein